MKPAAFLLLALLALPARAALDYAIFSHPKGDYVLQYPFDWQRSTGIQSLGLRPAGNDGKYLKVSVERYPVDRHSPPTAKDYTETLIKSSKGIKKLLSRKPVTVDGRTAERLAFSETAALKGEYGEKLPGPLNEVYVVVPLRDYYYVLKIQGVGEAFKKNLSEFDRMARTLRLRPARPAPPSAH